MVLNPICCPVRKPRGTLLEHEEILACSLICVELRALSGLPTGKGLRHTPQLVLLLWIKPSAHPCEATSCSCQTLRKLEQELGCGTQNGLRLGFSELSGHKTVKLWSSSITTQLPFWIYSYLMHVRLRRMCY